VKKLLVFALVAVMGVGLGATAFAAAGDIAPPAFSDIAGHEAEGALTILAALGIYSGDTGLGGAVRPDDPITRAQFCKVVVVAAGRATTAAGLAGLQPTFTDGASIPSWAWGYVNVAVYMGIIKGYEDGSFKPNNPVTYAESVTMLIRSVSGHTAQVGPGVWPYNFLFYGVDGGFTGGVDVGFANLPATRGDIAQMLLATMKVDKLNAKGEVIARSAVLADRLFTGTFSYSGAEVALLGQFTDPDGHDVDRVYATMDDPVYVVGATTLNSLLTLPVTAVLEKPYDWDAEDGTAEVLLVAEDTNVVTGVFDSMADRDLSCGCADTIVLEDGAEIPFVQHTTVPTVINRRMESQWSLGQGDELVMTLGDEGTVVNIAATRFSGLDFITHFEASETTPVKVDTYIETWAGSNTFIPAGSAVIINGATAGRDSLKVDDVVQIAWDWNTGDPYIIRVHREAVEGTVGGTSTSWPGPVSRVTIGLKAGGSKTYVLNDDGPVGLPSKGDMVKYGLDFDGQIFVPIGYETLTPYVVCTSYMVDGSGNATATFDVRGASVTYKVTGDFSHYAEDQHYLWIQVDTGTGTVTGWETIYPDDYWKIVAVDAANGTATLSDDGSPAGYIFIDDEDLVVYDDTTGGKVYIGLAGLAVGDWVRYDTDNDYPVFELTGAPPS